MKIESGSSLRAVREAMGLSQSKLSELTGISQHLLSSFELEKLELDPTLLAKVSQALLDGSRVRGVVGRRKRYQSHTYKAVVHDAGRALKHIQSKGNVSYTALLNALHASRSEQKHKALSLFAGCGGMSLGFSWAGYKIKGFVEIDEGLSEIYGENFPGAIKLGGDISSLSDSGIERTTELVGDIDVIIGGPPCQGFSLSGKRAVSDPRNTLFLDYLRFVDVYRPKFAVLENVRLLTSMRSPHGGFVKEEIEKEFYRRGYRVSIYDINAKSYGVPQHRERVFFFAIRDDIKDTCSFPGATHSQPSGDLFNVPMPYRTFADACSDLPFLESGEASDDPLHCAVNHPSHVIDWLWDVKEGYSAHDNEDPSKRPPSGYNTTYKRQVWLEPSATVQTTFGMISGCRNVHPIATRSLTVREAARLQSFPDAYKFKHSLGTIRTGIGNAVPPLLAYEIGKHILLYLL